MTKLNDEYFKTIKHKICTLTYLKFFVKDDKDSKQKVILIYKKKRDKQNSINL